MLYAVGQSIIDFEFNVSRSAQEALGLKVGTVTLVESEQEFNDFMARIEADHQLSNKDTGGSAANSAHIYARRSSAVLHTTIPVGSKEEWSVMYRRDRDDLFLTDTLCGGYVSKCIALIAEDGQRTLRTWINPESNVAIPPTASSLAHLATSLLFEGYLATSDKNVEKVKQLFDMTSSKLRNVAVNLNDVLVCAVDSPFRKNLDELTKKATILIGNVTEFKAYYNVNTVEELHAVCATSSKLNVITDGANPTYVITSTINENAPTHTIEVVNTNGAGDAFAGAFLLELDRGRSFKGAAISANLVASEVCKIEGTKIYSVTPL